MQKFTVLAVFDVQIGAFMQPMFVPAVGAGVRAFSDEVNRDGSPMKAHPTDYQLFCLGSFSDVDGSFDLEAKPALIVTAVSLVRQPELK